MARKMKDSGIEWIGEIPEGWELIKAKYLFSQRNEKGNSTLVLLSPTQKYGVIPQSQLEGVVQVKENTDLRTFKTIHIGDFVISLRSFQGGFEFSNYEGVCSPAYQVLHATKDLSNDFFRYLFKSDGFISKINSLTVGIREGKNIQYWDFSNMLLALPPKEIQIRSAQYLNAKCTEIDTMLSKTRSSIEEYKKLKQAVITQAVTKGVRGEREMKDCGVEWAGLVPHHWGVAKIGSIGQTSSGATPLRSKESSFFDDATIRWVRTLDLNDGFVYDSSEKITELALASSACSIMPKGTVCVAMYGGAGTIGKCGLLMSDCATNQAVCSIVCNRKIVSPIFLLMQLLALKPYWMKYAVGTRKDPNISQDIVARMKILIPPLDEQKEITDYLDAKCAEIDKLIAKKEQLVKELESYKKSLIYEVVTGKREV